MPRINIPKNAGPFNIKLSMVGTPIVANGKSGGNRVIIPCKDMGQAEQLCEKLNGLDPKKEHEVWY